MKLGNIISLAALGYSIYSSKISKISQEESAKGIKKLQDAVNESMNVMQDQLDTYSDGGNAGNIWAASFRMQVGGIANKFWTAAFWVTIENKTDQIRTISGVRLRFRINGVKSDFAPVCFIKKIFNPHEKYEFRLSGGDALKLWQSARVAHSVRDDMLAACPDTGSKNTVAGKLIAAKGYIWKNIADADVDILIPLPNSSAFNSKTLLKVKGNVTYMGASYPIITYGQRKNGYDEKVWDYPVEY